MPALWITILLAVLKPLIPFIVERILGFFKATKDLPVAQRKKAWGRMGEALKRYRRDRDAGALDAEVEAIKRDCGDDCAL